MISAPSTTGASCRSERGARRGAAETIPWFAVATAPAAIADQRRRSRRVGRGLPALNARQSRCRSRRSDAVNPCSNRGSII